MRPPITRLVADGTPFSARWGRVEVTSRQMAQSLRSFNAAIVIYPPGTTKAQSFWLTVRGFGTSWVGAGIVLVLLILCVGFLGVWIGGAIAIVVPLALWFYARLASAETHKGIRRVHARFTPGTETGAARFEDIASQLDMLDSTSTVDPVEYELRWGLIYDQAR